MYMYTNGTWGWDGQLRPCSLEGMIWNVPDSPIPYQCDLGMEMTAGTMIWYSMVWDVPDSPIPYQCDLGMEMTAGTMICERI